MLKSLPTILRNSFQLLVFAFFVVATFIPTSANARNYLTRDGQFSICQSADILADCELLTEEQLEKLHLSAEQRKRVLEIKKYAEIRGKLQYQDLVESFGPLHSSEKIPGPENSNAVILLWLYKDSSEDPRKSEAISFIFDNDKLSVIGYKNFGTFSIIWNRPAKN